MKNKGNSYSRGGRGKRITSNLSLMLALLCIALVSLPLSASAMPMPSGGSFFEYKAAALPVDISDPSIAQPLGLGSAAEGGDKFSLQVGLEAFDGPVDIYLGISAPKIDPVNIYLLTPGNSSQPLSQGLIPWRANVTGPVSEAILGDIPVSALPPGPYNFYVLITPVGSLNSYYLWQTQTELLSLTVDKMGSGTVSSDVGGIDCGNECVKTYAAGAAVSLDAVAATGKEFLKWGGCDVSSGNVCALVMSKDRTVMPIFGIRPEIKPNVKVINENIAQCLTVTNNPDETATYSFDLGKCPDQVTELSHLSEGDVLLGLSAIVRITAVDSSLAGHIVAETVKGNLSDIADRGTIAFSTTFSLPEAAGSSAAALRAQGFNAQCPAKFGPPDTPTGDGIGIQLNLDKEGPCMLTYSEGGAQASIGLSGYTNLVLTGTAGWTWDRFLYVVPYLEEVHVSLRLESHTDLTVKANADWHSEDKAELGNTPLAPLWLGIFYVQPYLAINARIEGQAHMALTTGFNCDAVLGAAGIKYTFPLSVAPWAERPSMTCTGKKLRLMTSGELKVGLESELSFMIYDIIGPTLGAGGYLRMKASTDQDKVDWCLSGGVEGYVGAKVAPFGYDIWADDLPIPIYEDNIAGTCTGEPMVTIGPIASIETPSNDFYTNKPVSFKGSAHEYAGRGTLTNCIWDFGDGTQETSPIDGNGECATTNPHHYEDGDYTAKLTVNDGYSTATATSRVYVSTVPPPPPSNVKITSRAFTAPAITSQAVGSALLIEVPYYVSWDPPTRMQYGSNNLTARRIPLDVTYKTWLRAKAEDGTLLRTEVQSLKYTRDVISFGHKESMLCYQVVAVDKYGNESDPLALGTYACTGTIYPQKKFLDNPGSMRTGLSTSNQLTWSEIAGKNLSYTIFRDNVAVKTLVSPPFYDTGLKPDVSYCYKLGLNRNGKLIDTSDKTCLRTSSDAVSPTTPTGFAAVSTSSSVIELFWNPATDNVGVEGYRIYNSNTTGITYRTSVTSTEPSVSGLSADTTYCFKVSAYDKAGNESPKSAQVCATTPHAGVTCTYAFTVPSNGDFGAGGGQSTLTVLPSDNSCSWTATSNADWITVTGGSSGTGSGTVSYSVSANTGTSQRNGTIRAAGRNFTVTQVQAASPCTYTLSPTNNTYYSAEGGSGIYTGSFSVTTSGSNCSWSATSDSAWITITSGNSGTGNGTGTYIVSPNNSSAGRTGTISVGDQTFTVTQDGQPQPCTYALSPTNATFSSRFTGSGEFRVTPSDSSCSWTATSDASWLTITSGSSGTGVGRVSYLVGPFDFIVSLTGTITVVDQTFTVTTY